MVRCDQWILHEVLTDKLNRLATTTAIVAGVTLSMQAEMPNSFCDIKWCEKGWNLFFSIATEELFRTIDWTSGGDKSGRKSSKLFAKVIAKIQKWFLDHWWWALVSFCWNLSIISLISKVLGVWFIILKSSSLPITHELFIWTEGVHHQQ